MEDDKPAIVEALFEHNLTVLEFGHLRKEKKQNAQIRRPIFSERNEWVKTFLPPLK